VRKSINNICCEFSNSYLQSDTENEEILSLKINIFHTTDLSDILEDYGFELETLTMISQLKAVVIFVRKKNKNDTSPWWT